jgi:hypothetical protein
MILHNEKLRGIYIAHYIIRAVKLRGLQWAEHVIDMWRRCVQNFCMAITWKTKIKGDNIKLSLRGISRMEGGGI